jgi:hypothetical protein
MTHERIHPNAIQEALARGDILGAGAAIDSHFQAVDKKLNLAPLVIDLARLATEVRNYINELHHHEVMTKVEADVGAEEAAKVVTAFHQILQTGTALTGRLSRCEPTINLLLAVQANPGWQVPNTSCEPLKTASRYLNRMAEIIRKSHVLLTS